MVYRKIVSDSSRRTGRVIEKAIRLLQQTPTEMVWRRQVHNPLEKSAQRHLPVQQ